MIEQSNLYEVLRRPLLTEKCAALKDSQKKILVEVAPWANKDQIIKAAKMLFDVDVLSVNTMNYRGKVKRVRQHIGKRSNTKKAYLTLANGSDVDLFGMVGQEVARDEIKSA